MSRPIGHHGAVKKNDLHFTKSPNPLTFERAVLFEGLQLLNYFGDVSEC